MMMDSLNYALRDALDRPLEPRKSRVRDSRRDAGSDYDEMLPRASEIRTTLHGRSARGALILPPPARLQQVGVTAMRADAIDRLIPGDEVAGRVPLAAKEGATLLRPPLDNLSFAASWTAHANACQERTRIATIRKPATGLELPEFP